VRQLAAAFLISRKKGGSKLPHSKKTEVKSGGNENNQFDGKWK
jgi:hypothetical protein